MTLHSRAVPSEMCSKNTSISATVPSNAVVALVNDTTTASGREN